jgi:hypothetical protein
VNTQDQIQSLEAKIIGLAGLAAEQLRELDELKKRAAKPTPVRRDLKTKRVAEVEMFYMRRKIKAI